jgi:transposase
MDASTLTPDSPLPDDVGTLKDLIRQLLAEVASLRGKLEAALKHRFGKRSERRTAPAESVAKRKPGKAAPHGRSALPEHLPRREVVFDLSEEQKPCPCCGKPRVCIGADATEQLEMEPIKFFVLRTVKKKYACQDCAPPQPGQDDLRFTTAGPAQVGPIPKGLCAPTLLAHVITAKFADHCPINRLAEQLARSGVTIARSTLGDWLRRAAKLLEPLVALMRQRVLLARVIHGDDTGVKRRVTGKPQTSRAHLWTYIGDADHPYRVFDFTADYTAAGPEDFLKGYKGYLQADALAQYEGLYREGLKHVCCWAHARRKFVAAKDKGDQQAQQALDWIGALYAIERELPELLGPAADPEKRRQSEEERKRIRQQKAKPILEALKRWLDETKGKTLPKSVLGQALGYALNNWEALCRYVEQGYLGIDNLSERTLRPVALGRNNWVVVGSETGGQTAAVLYTVVQSCKHLGIDPLAYLGEALPGLFALGDSPTAEQLSAWLPDAWQQRQPAKTQAVPTG